MEIQIVEFFKSWGCKFCDVFFSFTNILGEDLFFYLVFFALYWCYKKQFAFKFAGVYMINCVFNVFFKKIVGRPRPVGATEGGNSFPSGHSQSYASVGMGLLYEANRNKYPTKKWQRVELWLEFVIFGALVGIGRMYFGQHYLTDVLAGLLLGVIVTVVATYIIDLIATRWNIGLDKILLILIPFVVVGYIVVAVTNIFDDPSDLAKIYRVVGLYLSVVVGYFVDKKWIKYTEDDTLKNKMIKIISGSAVLMMLYAFVLKDLTVNALYPLYYFGVGIVATVVLPWVFKTIKNEPPQKS